MTEDFSISPEHEILQNTGASTLDTVASPESSPYSILDPGDETVCRELLERATDNVQVFSEIVVILDTSWSSAFESIIQLLLEMDEKLIAEFLFRCPHKPDSRFLKYLLNNNASDVAFNNATPLAHYLVDVFDSSFEEMDQELYQELVAFLNRLLSFESAFQILSQLNFSVILSFNSAVAFDILVELAESVDMRRLLLAYSGNLQKKCRQRHSSNFEVAQMIHYSEFFAERLQTAAESSRTFGNHTVFPVEPDDPLKNPATSHHVHAIYRSDALTDLPSMFITHSRPEAITALRKAREVLPAYVSSSDYPELDHDLSPPLGRSTPSQPKSVGRYGYREVFAGETIERLAFYEGIPTEILQDVFAQRDYCLIELLARGIHHNDSTNNNFNVRWLLTNEDGTQKSLSFSLASALARANESNLSITPIVTLRDWEEAEYVPEMVWSR